MQKRFFFVFLFSLFLSCAVQGADPPRELRVLCYNIHIAIGMDNKLDIERTAKLINEQKADLVALQEVDRNAKRTEKQDQPALLEKLTGLKAVFGKTVAFANGGEYGIAVLSRFPVKEQKMTQLPQQKGQEDRGLLETVVELDGKTQIRFCCTHFCHISDERRTLQADKVNELLASNDVLTILAGDFNAEPESNAIKTILRQWTDATDRTATFSSTDPKIKIDY
ncbi:MAG: endonuclease/exonuclease/phosphatase family protein, partial [Planctomycetaceae bacterium]|nr:endonuclease/exonuclease/phosphatase family protein [Planctomycetaceae bacterium]